MKTIRTILFVAVLLFTGTLGYTNPIGGEEGAHISDHEKNIPVSNVRGVDITIACELYIRQGDEEKLRIEAEKNIFNRLEIEVRDSILYIESDHRDNNFDDWDVEVYLTVKTLRKIDIGGAVKLRTENTLETPKLDLDISGAADIEIEIETEKLLADFSGAVKAELEGRARYVVMDMSGASKVEADDLITDAFYLDFSGFGKADIYSEKVLKVDMSGMGVVKYDGNPDKVEANSSGLGVIKSR
jgi:hypothetical protein